MRLFLILIGTTTAAAVLVLQGGTAAEAPARYQGDRNCKACHRAYHASWVESDHRRAFEALTPEQVANGKDPEGRACVVCHTTGYGRGGFVSLVETPRLANVGCEACHGPGSEHVKVMVAAMLDEAEVPEKHIERDVDCARCHEPHVSHKKIYGSRK